MWLVDTLTCLLMSCAPANIRVSSEEAAVNNQNVTSDNRDGLPVVCWHGVNDDARSCDMIFSTLNSSRETLSIQVGDTLEADKYNSIFMGMLDQVTREKCIIIIIIMT